jgi:SAM-dependent methyltransferase
MDARPMTQSPPRDVPPLDLDYSVDEDIPGVPGKRDSRFVFERMPQLITDKATEGHPGRVLDVGCGFGGQMALLRERDWETWGLDASFALARHCGDLFDGPRSPVVCAAAEALPYRNASFDSIVCQGSLDHFARPEAFLREVARVLRPDGRAVIALANYGSLSSRLGNNWFRIKRRLGMDVYQGRNYWEIPLNHTFRGTHRVLLDMGSRHLDLVECRGVSLLWLFTTWTRFVELLPEQVARFVLRSADAIAYRSPAMADILVSVWRPKP